MKDSGIEWIGAIPDSWHLDRLQWHLDEIKESNKPVKTQQVLSLTNKLGVIPYEEKGEQGNKSKENIDEYKLAYPDTIVANSMNILIGSVGKCKYFGCVSPVYYVFKPKNGENIDFLNYVFQLTQFQKELRKYANGILEIRLRVSSNDILKRQIAFPSGKEQQKIVSFLNEKMAKIDKLIEIENNQIEKLKEYKQAVITEAVTKGLDKSAPMKDSGVEWIGEIPEEWSVKKIKFAYQSRIEKYVSGEFPYIALENIESMSGKYVFTDSNTNYSLDGSIFAKKGDVIFGKLRPYLAKTLLVNDDSYVSAEFMVLHDNNNLPAFLKYLFLSICFIDVVNSSTCGTKMPRANAEFIQNLYIALPNLSKQRQIVGFLDKKCKKIDFLTEIKQKKIDMLNEYKKSLIYEYVTGKKEVV